MKQAITILTIYLLAFAGTQNAQAQTKEETIAWRKEKLEKYGGGIIRQRAFYECTGKPLQE